MPAPTIDESNATGLYTLAGQSVHDWVTGVLDRLPAEMSANDRERVVLWRQGTQANWYNAREVWQAGRHVEAARLMVSIANVTAQFDRAVTEMAERARASWGANFLASTRAARDEFFSNVSALVDAVAAVPGQVIDAASNAVATTGKGFALAAGVVGLAVVGYFVVKR